MNTYLESLLWCFNLISLGIVVQCLEVASSPRLARPNGAFRGAFGGKFFRFVLVMRLLIAVISILSSSFVLLDHSVSLPWLPILVSINWTLNILFFLHFGGGLTGGSDSMLNLSLTAAMLGQWSSLSQFSVFFIGVQCLVSYFIPGCVKLKEKEWRNGKALGSFLQNSIFENPQWLIRWTNSPMAMKFVSWIVIVAEIFFPILILSNKSLLLPLLTLGFLFHCLNAWLFGISRFVYSWVATYPCLYLMVHEISFS